MNKIIFLIIGLSFSFAEINLSGDARIRPRLDIKDTSETDLYYLYRARLNIDTDIGDGWFFKSTLGINSGTASVKMGVDETFTDTEEMTIETDDPYIIYEYHDGYTNTVPGGNANSARPTVSFLNLYYGIKKEKFGLWGGAIPLKHNPALDIHFYPELIVDLPWSVLNNSSTTGFAGYINKLNWFISVDGNNKEIDKNAPIEKHIDPFTIGFDFAMKWNKYINIHPRALFSVKDPLGNFPITFGLDMNFKDIFKIYPSFSYYYTMQTIDQDNQYNGSHIRIKLNREFSSGKFTFWTDIAEYTDIDIDDVKTEFMYIWIDYDYNLFNSDLGSISIKPTVRYQIGKLDDSDYNRIKLELTTGIKFK